MMFLVTSQTECVNIITWSELRVRPMRLMKPSIHQLFFRFSWLWYIHDPNLIFNFATFTGRFTYMYSIYHTYNLASANSVSAFTRSKMISCALFDFVVYSWLRLLNSCRWHRQPWVTFPSRCIEHSDTSYCQCTKKHLTIESGTPLEETESGSDLGYTLPI